MTYNIIFFSLLFFHSIPILRFHKIARKIFVSFSSDSWVFSHATHYIFRNRFILSVTYCIIQFTDITALPHLLTVWRSCVFLFSWTFCFSRILHSFFVFVSISFSYGLFSCYSYVIAVVVVVFLYSFVVNNTNIAKWCCLIRRNPCFFFEVA